jgi:hypothetical protein
MIFGQQINIFLEIAAGKLPGMRENNRTNKNNVQLLSKHHRQIGVVAP